MNKKIISFLVVLLLVFTIFAGCEKQEGTATPTPSAEPSASQAPAEQSPTPNLPEELTLPITDTVTTFDIWIPALAVKAGQVWGMQTPNDSLAYQELEKRTNIHINWLVPSEGSEVENFNLILTSGNLPDSFIGGQFGNAGYDSYIDDQFIIDLKDLIKNYAPDYEALRTSAEDIRRLSMTDMGRVPYFQSVRLAMEPSFMGTLVRQDWLDAAGYQGLPETYDEFHDMLVALKDKSAIAPLYMMSRTGLDEELMVGFGVNDDFFQVDGKVKYGPIEPGFKDYITMIRQWYSEGLVDPEFYARKTFLTGDMASMLNGDFGAFFHLYTFIDVMENASPDENYNISAVAPPVHNKGDKRYISYYGQPFDRLEGTTATITPACEDPVSLVKWFDYFFTEEGSLLCEYGIADAYNLVDGRPVPTELISANPDDLGSSAALAKYAMSALQPRVTRFNPVENAAVSDKAKSAWKTWDSNREDKYNLTSALSVSSEDSAEFASLLNDITTYVTESIVPFITGEKPMEEFDEFVNQIKSMGIDRCIEIKQQALDRFIAR